MSYNQRRNQAGFGNQQSSNNVGQRRPPAVGNNFISGGQLAGSQPQQQQFKPQIQQQQQRPPQQQQQQQQQQQPSGNVRTQNQRQNHQTQSYNTPSQVQTPMKPIVQTTVNKEVPTPKPATVQQPQQSASTGPGSNLPAPQQESMDTSGEAVPKKRIWPNKGTMNKISRAEKVRRRNLKLSKILQPKNAVMILNELIKGCVYNVEELPVKIDVNQFRGTVSFDGLEFAGTGKNKVAAKNAAAETALKHLVKNKKIASLKKEDEDAEKMDISEEDGNQVMPWSHIASFAMFKLFSAWGEDPNSINPKVENQAPQQEMKTNANSAGVKLTKDPRPAKKMPDNPETLNPMMLMHQMLPNAVWDEMGKSGITPNIVFQMRVTIGDRSFTGTGPNKKAAKKMAAFAACHELLHINYPPEVWLPLY